MAHGYAWAGGGLGVVLTTSGPAAANALTGTVNADTACCPLLTITGEVPEKTFGKGYLQEGIDAGLDIDTIYRNAVSYSAVVANESDAGTLIEQALRVARSQPSRAAHLSIPNDVAGACVTDPTNKTNPYTIWFPDAPSRYRTVPRGTDAGAVKLGFGDLAGATRPLLFLGNGARLALSDPDRMARFTQLVHDWALPVMTTPDAKGIFSETHGLSLRNYGLCACAWPDVYIAPGTPDRARLEPRGARDDGRLQRPVLEEPHTDRALHPRRPGRGHDRQELPRDPRNRRRRRGHDRCPLRSRRRRDSRYRVDGGTA